jgi:hypothetical protein
MKADHLDFTFPWNEGEHYDVAANGCWEWKLALTDPGYARVDDSRMRRLYGTMYAHRLGWFLLYGVRLGKKTDLHHRCENRRCVNPDHLEVVGRSEHLKLHRRTDSVLTEQDVIEMRWAAYHGEPLASLARRYGLGSSAVGRVVRGDNWKDVGGPIGRPVKTCGRCGAPVVGRGRKAIYCSLECQEKINKEKLRMKAVA